MDEVIRKQGLFDSANQAIDLITRPPRGDYNPKNLGDIEINENLVITRIPVSFINSNGLTIMGSLYCPPEFPDVAPLSCVIYLHGNAGTQVEGRFMVKYLAPIGIACFCFDFSGSGQSDGDIVTLGLNEKQDVIDACSFLTKSFDIKKFVLWGRSMGAATTFLAASHIPNCLGIIADSPYYSTHALFKDMADKVKIPAIIQGPAIWYVKNRVNGKLNGDIYDVSPEECAKQLEIPILIGHGAEDSFIPFSQSKHLYEVYKGKDKALYPLPCDHNIKRPIEWINTCFGFICRLNNIEFTNFIPCPPPSAVKGGTDQHFKSFEDMVKHSKH